MTTSSTEQGRPNGSDHRRALARLRKAAQGSATDRDLVQLAYHLRWCSSCREVYDRQVGIDRELAGLGGADRSRLVPLERALARAAILEASSESPGLLRILRWRWWVGVSAAAAVALLLLLLLPVLSRFGGPPPSVEPEFTTRGDGEIAVRLFCVRPKVATEQFRPASTDGGAADGCRLDESLKVTYLNTTGRHRYLWVLGLDDQLEIKWYYPTPDARSGVPIKMTRELRPLPDMVKLQVNHRPGPVRVFALFSDDKISSTRIERAVGRLRKQHLPLGRIHAIPLGAEVLQIVQDLRILR